MAYSITLLLLSVYLDPGVNVLRKPVLRKKSKVIHRGYIYSDYYWAHVFNLITPYDPFALRLWLLKQNYFTYTPVNGNCNSRQQPFVLQKT